MLLILWTRVCWYRESSYKRLQAGSIPAVSIFFVKKKFAYLMTCSYFNFIIFVKNNF